MSPLNTSTLTFVPMSKVVKLFHAGIRGTINEEISNSNISYGWSKQSTFISRDTFCDLINGITFGDDCPEDQLATLKAAVNAGISKVMKCVDKETALLVEA